MTLCHTVTPRSLRLVPLECPSQYLSGGKGLTRWTRYLLGFRIARSSVFSRRQAIPPQTRPALPIAAKWVISGSRLGRVKSSLASLLIRRIFDLDRRHPLLQLLACDSLRLLFSDKSNTFQCPVLSPSREFLLGIERLLKWTRISRAIDTLITMAAIFSAD